LAAFARWRAAAAEMGAAAFFFLCAVLQLNDPDPWIWTLMYMGSGFMPSAYSGLRGDGESLPLGLTCAAAALPVALILQALPSVIIAIFRSDAPADILFSESFREAAGCAIVLTSLVLPRQYYYHLRVALVAAAVAALISWRYVLLEHGPQGSAPHCRSLLTWGATPTIT
jgi:hypothetical protein